MNFRNLTKDELDDLIVAFIVRGIYIPEGYDQNFGHKFDLNDYCLHINYNRPNDVYYILLYDLNHHYNFLLMYDYVPNNKCIKEKLEFYEILVDL